MKKLLFAPLFFCCSFLAWSHGYVGLLPFYEVENSKSFVFLYSYNDNFILSILEKIIMNKSANSRFLFKESKLS